MGYIEKSAEFSAQRLELLRSELIAKVPSDQIVVTCGSYARRDASVSSDLDYFTIVPEEGGQPADAEIAKVVDRIIGKAPSRDGAFANTTTANDLLRNFGGSNDSNATITRRMLFLLEGDYLTNQESFSALRVSIIERYVDETKLDHQIAFYLLNDLIRYWRTLAVDYAQKTYGTNNPKPWAIRNVKLVFSRKLIYASGLFSVALTADRTRDAKVELLSKLFAMTPIERIKYVCGESASERACQLYEYFLEQIGNKTTRDHLEILHRDHKETDKIFRNIKNEGHYFSRELFGLFESTFHSSHPIHMAVVF